MLVEPALMKEVEKMNIVMVYLNQQAVLVPHNPYAIKVNYKNRNYYNCGRFGHLARNCKNRRIEGRIGKGRRLKYRGNNRLYNNNLNKDGNLIVPNQILITVIDLQYL